MSSRHHLAAVAAVTHAKAYNLTRHYSDRTPHLAYLGVHVFLASATICGVMLAVCVACWRRTTPSKAPTPAHHRQRALDVYAIEISTSAGFQEYIRPISSPPPAYETVINKPPPSPITQPHAGEMGQQNTQNSPDELLCCARCAQVKVNCQEEEGLPSYEAAVKLENS